MRSECLESGRAGRLEEAVAAYREALKVTTRARVPLLWAMEEAVAAYREALQEATRDRAPLYWAATQVGLGTALFRLGERESGTARLEEAVAAYRDALEEWTRECVRESGTARLEEAVAAYREALSGKYPRARAARSRSNGPRAPAIKAPPCRSPNGAAMRRWQSWRSSRSRRLLRQCATAAMRLPPPILKRNCRKPARWPKNSPSADEPDHSAGTTAIDTRLIFRDFHRHARP